MMANNLIELARDIETVMVGPEIILLSTREDYKLNQTSSGETTS